MCLWAGAFWVLQNKLVDLSSLTSGARDMSPTDLECFNVL